MQKCRMACVLRDAFCQRTAIQTECADFCGVVEGMKATVDSFCILHFCILHFLEA